MRTVLQTWKTVTLAAAAVLFMAAPSQAAMKNIICAKTNTGNYFPVVRISMMVVPDGGSTFEIILKDGKGEAGVQSISFEKHEVDIDLSKYNKNTDGTAYIDMSKPVFLYTNTGKFWKLKELPTMSVQEGTSLIDITIGSAVEKGVKDVHFYRGDESGINDAMSATAIKNPAAAPASEKLQLMTPISEQMTVSGCGDASVAIVYSLDGKKMTEARVANGATTVYVGQMPAGVYVLRVGHKALKFTKR